MQKSFILALGAFAVVAFLFVFSGQQTTTEEIVTSFDVGNNGMTEIENKIINIEPASGDTTEVILDDAVSLIEGSVAADVDAVLAIEEDVIDMVEDAKTADIEINDDGISVIVDGSKIIIE